VEGVAAHLVEKVCGGAQTVGKREGRKKKVGCQASGQSAASPIEF
jgi:hypothetical protein